MTTIRSYTILEKNQSKRFPAHVEPYHEYVGIHNPDSEQTRLAFLEPDLAHAKEVHIGFWDEAPAGPHINLAPPGSKNAKRNQAMLRLYYKEGKAHVENVSGEPLQMRTHGNERKPLGPGMSVQIYRAGSLEIPRIPEQLNRHPYPVEIWGSSVDGHHRNIADLELNWKMGEKGHRKLGRIWVKDTQKYGTVYHRMLNNYLKNLPKHFPEAPLNMPTKIKRTGTLRARIQAFFDG